ncbi:MAG: hypothetical protein R3F17_13255 [Planctomycetota bacterium]
MAPPLAEPAALGRLETGLAALHPLRDRRDSSPFALLWSGEGNCPAPELRAAVSPGIALLLGLTLRAWPCWPYDPYRKVRR